MENLLSRSIDPRVTKSEILKKISLSPQKVKFLWIEITFRREKKKKERKEIYMVERNAIV